AAALAATTPQSALAGDGAAPNSYVVAAGETRKSLQLGVGRSVIVDLPQDATEIFVGDPKVANAVVRSARRLYVAAVANGQTTIFALAADGSKIAAIDVTVGRDIGELQQLLNAALPGNEITVKTVADSIILIGSVASAGDAQKALDIASGFVGTSVLGGASNASQAAPAAGGGASMQVSVAPSGTPLTGKVINSLTIRGLDQVSVRVTISEIRRDIVKQLGVNMAGNGGKGENNFAISNPFSVNAAPSTEATIGWAMAGMNLSATLQAFERQGVARTLAEPTVTAVSGESAKFLAGGTIPILNGESCSAGACTPSIVQQPYGVSLNFTPVVLSQSRIQLRIATEVTDVDTSHSMAVTDITSVPGFRTRKNETTVELPSGGSIASAGLISTQTQQAITGVPGLMNVPVLGSLFRSRDYQRQETELLVIVTPYIVHAIDPNQVARPDQNFQDASDPQAWLLGRVNRIYSTSGALQPMPGYSGRVGFITD
ncbi:MAG: type II and III secretion system protein family protein, partial [Roseiarcus sp.]